MNTETVPIDSLSPDPANVRLHGPRNLEAIKGSLRRFGQQKPIVVDARGIVVAGNGTLEAARALGWTEIAVVRTELVGVEATAFAIADNRTAELAEWDTQALAAALNGLATEDAEVLGASGFSEEELRTLSDLATGEAGGLEDDGGAHDLVSDPVVQPGDLWRVGRHRVLCGDSTDAACVERLLAGARPLLMVTDPPYGVEYDPAWRNEAGLSNTERTGKVANDDRVDWTAVWSLFPGDVAYVWHAGRHCGEVAANLFQAGFEIRAQIIWAKSRFALSRGNYHWQHEPCWYAVRKGRKAHWTGDRSQSTLWTIPVTDDGDPTVHGTQKPLECMGRPIRHHSATEVFEPFLGSGTTLVACEKLERTCFALELQPLYVETAIRRWERLTGQQATREDGATLEVLGAAPVGATEA